MSHYKVSIIVALSSNRVPLFLDRALPSIYTQTLTESECCNMQVIVCCDDFLQSQIKELENNIMLLRKKLGLPKQAFSTIILPNTRRKKYSGTGAWNSAAFYCIDTSFATNENRYLAFLDDDDAWKHSYLSECLHALETSNEYIGLIASGIVFLRMTCKSYVFQIHKR